MDKENQLIELAALWLNEAKDGSKYMSGKINGLNVLVFKNKFKEKDNQPDYRIYLAKAEKKEASDE